MLNFALELFRHVDLYSLSWASERGALLAMSPESWTCVCPGTLAWLLRLIVGGKMVGSSVEAQLGADQGFPPGHWDLEGVSTKIYLDSNYDKTLRWKCFAFTIFAWICGCQLWLHIRITWQPLKHGVPRFHPQPLNLDLWVRAWSPDKVTICRKFCRKLPGDSDREWGLKTSSFEVSGETPNLNVLDLY